MPRPERPPNAFPWKTALAVLTLAALLVIPEFVPALGNYRMLDLSRIPAVLDFSPRKTDEPQVAEDRVRPRPDVRHEQQPLVDPEQSLDHFYEALRRTEARQPGAVTQVVHYGDSPTTADLITADVRNLLQQQFGDAGHGYFLIAKPWAWYGHRGVDLNSSGWNVDPATQSEVRDGVYGLGGVSFRGQLDARTRISLRRPGHTQMEIAFLRQPGGGSFEALAGSKPLGVVETASDEAEPGYATFSFPADEDRFEIRVTSGAVRLFGVQLRKPGPGVVYHSLGLNGASVTVLSRMFKKDHWAGQLRHYQPDLVIVNYGTNESGYPSFVDTTYAKEVQEALRRIRSALPEASVLVMSPMDRGQRETGGEIGTVPSMARLVATQQRIAAETHCAFFNTFQAMGGPGTMGKWYQAEPRLVGADFIHPMPAGAKIVGNLLYKALLDGFARYKLRYVEQRAARLDPRVK